jgi:signal peptidase I
MVEIRQEPQEQDGSALPSQGWALLLSLFSPGVGHFYIGRTSLAVAWATLPVFLFALYLVALLRVPLPWLYGTFFVSGIGVFVGARAGALLDVLRLPSTTFRRARALHVALFLSVAVAYSVLGATLVRHRVGEAFKIPGGAMQPTLLIGDHIMVDKQAFRGMIPPRGSLVVFESPEKRGYDFLERAIALPGDRLEVVDGHPWLNGWEVPHCKVGQAALPDRLDVPGQLELEYLADEMFLIFLEDGKESAHEGPYVVKPGEIWVLGDNRGNSFDSRYWFGGAGGGVPFENLKGRAAFNWLAFNVRGYPEWSRMGVSVDEARLPHELMTLEPALRSCMSQRPKTTVPPPAAAL